MFSSFIFQIHGFFGNVAVPDQHEFSKIKIEKQAHELEVKMREAAKELDFERAAEYRDSMILLKGELGKRKGEIMKSK